MTTTTYSPLRIAALATLACALSSSTALAQTAFAATVIDYHPGLGASLDNPYAAIGQPGEIVGAGSGFDGVYGPFNPHFESTEVAQIGEGGELILRLEKSIQPIAGQTELGIFTNVGLIFTDGVNSGVFGVDSVLIDVSPDGVSWTALGEQLCDFPASAFTDSPSPFHPTSDGLTPSDFGKPHTLQLSDLDGLSHAQVLAALDGSAGGTWIDLSASGVSNVNYLRFRVEENATFELVGVSINDAAAVDAPTPLKFVEDFATNPIGTRATSTPGHASYANGQLEAIYNLSTPAARTTWALGQTLTDQTSFRYSVEFTINSLNFSSSSFGQLSFGLINSITTGDDRTTFPSDSYDLLTVDYFPSEQFPSLTPTVIGSQQPGQTNAFDNLGFPEGTASFIDDPGEIEQLPINTVLTASIDYDAATRLVTLRLADQSINTDFTNTDDDVSTIQYTIPMEFEFSVDSFAILCWQESSGGTANLSFTNIEVTTGSQPPANYYSWADANIANPLERAANFDADSDGLRNLLEYALTAAPTTAIADNSMSLNWQSSVEITDVTVQAWESTDLKTWTALTTSTSESEPGFIDSSASTSLTGERKFLRLEARRP